MCDSAQVQGAPWRRLRRARRGPGAAAGGGERDRGARERGRRVWGRRGRVSGCGNLAVAPIDGGDQRGSNGTG
jgi:hypothetical protein